MSLIHHLVDGGVGHHSCVLIQAFGDWVQVDAVVNVVEGHRLAVIYAAAHFIIKVVGHIKLKVSRVVPCTERNAFFLLIVVPRDAAHRLKCTPQ